MKQAVLRDTPIGPLTIAAHSGKICAVSFGDRLSNVSIDETQQVEEPALGSESVLRQAIRELEAYFRGALRDFTVPVSLEGPPFYVRVWEHLRRIPFGQVETYGQIATSLHRPGGARAVGNACGANPVAVIVPCHRVVASGGLGGYGGGLDLKTWLLRHEGSLR